MLWLEPLAQPPNIRAGRREQAQDDRDPSENGLGQAASTPEGLIGYGTIGGAVVHLVMVRADSFAVRAAVIVDDAGQQEAVGSDRERGRRGHVADLSHDVGAGLGQADDQHALAAEPLRIAILGRMHELALEAGQLGDVPMRRLERAGADRHGIEGLVGRDTVAARGDDVALCGLLDVHDVGVEADRPQEAEPLGVVAEVFEVLLPRVELAAAAEREIRVGHQPHGDGQHEVVEGLGLRTVVAVTQPDAADVGVSVVTDDLMPLVEKLFYRRQSARACAHDTNLHSSTLLIGLWPWWLGFSPGRCIVQARPSATAERRAGAVSPTASNAL